MLLNIDSIIIDVRPQYSQCSFVQYMQFCAVYTLVHLYICTLVHSCPTLLCSSTLLVSVRSCTKSQVPALRGLGGGLCDTRDGKLMPDFRSLGKLFTSYHHFFSLDIDTFAEF